MRSIYFVFSLETDIDIQHIVQNGKKGRELTRGDWGDMTGSQITNLNDGENVLFRHRMISENSGK